MDITNLTPEQRVMLRARIDGEAQAQEIIQKARADAQKTLDAAMISGSARPQLRGTK